MVEKHREPAAIRSGSEETTPDAIAVVGISDDKILSLRQAYLNGQLVVNSERLADKMLSFERQIEIVFPEEDGS